MQHPLAKLAFALCLAATACAASNRARGSLAGRAFDGRITSAEYCDHCSGGTLVTVVFRGAGSPFALILEAESCYDGSEEKLGFDSRARVFRYQKDVSDPAGDAKEGEIRMRTCNEKHLDASFWARFPDGSEVRGDVSTPLEFDAGYD